VPEIHGYRGARALQPENTLPGLAWVAVGVHALEFDVTRPQTASFSSAGHGC